MKSIQKIALLSLCASAFLSSCQTTKSSTYDYDYLMITKQGVIQRPVLVDLEVDKVKQTITRTFRNTTLDVAKQNIVKEFIKTAVCDVVVQPSWDTEAEAGMGKTTVEITLTGFPAKYKNFRNYEAKDADLLIGRQFLLNSGLPVNTSTQTQKTGLMNILRP